MFVRIMLLIILCLSFTPKCYAEDSPQIKLAIAKVSVRVNSIERKNRALQKIINEVMDDEGVQSNSVKILQLRLEEQEALGLDLARSRNVLEQELSFLNSTKKEVEELKNIQKINLNQLQEQNLKIKEELGSYRERLDTVFTQMNRSFAFFTIALALIIGIIFYRAKPQKSKKVLGYESPMFSPYAE